MLDLLINKTENESPGERLVSVSDRVDKPLKSVLKSVSWRIIGTIDTIIISYFITGKVTLAVSIGGLEVITKTLLYYFHERLWARIHRIRLNIFKRRDEESNKLIRVNRVTERQNNRRVSAVPRITVSG